MQALSVFGLQAWFSVGRHQYRNRDWIALVREELGAGYISNLRVREFSFHALQHAYAVGRSSVVVAKQDCGLVGKWADYGDALHGLQRQHAVVLQQHHRFVRKPARQCAMRRAIKLALIDLAVRDRLRGVEHAQPHARCE